MLRIKGYGILDVIYLSLSLIYTKFVIRQARLIRFPLRLRKLGKLVGAKKLTLGVGNRIDIFAGAYLKIGDNIQMNDYNHIACSSKIDIGNNVLIASKVYITDHDHDFSSSSKHPVDWPLKTKPVFIGDNCWIGENVSILKGVNLGDNCVVGANSVVTKSFPAGSVVVGSPAYILSKR